MSRALEGRRQNRMNVNFERSTHASICPAGQMFTVSQARLSAILRWVTPLCVFSVSVLSFLLLLVKWRYCFQCLVMHTSDDYYALRKRQQPYTVR